MRIPRVGHINFLNCLPLTYSFQQESFAEGLQVSSAVPAVLNNDIINHKLDVSPVSSIVYARNSEQFLLMPDVCITADGEVQSIILISKKPISDLTNDRIVLTAKSATSHCLLKIIMEKSYGARPNYVIRQVGAGNAVQEDATATLLIGDDALYVHHHPVAGLYYYDIGAEWKKFTGLCMVYAVWIVNRNFASEHQDLLLIVHERITRGFKNGYLKKRQAINSTLSDNPFSFAELDEYLEVIKWNFGTEQQEALLRFYILAQEMNLIDHVPEFALAEVFRSE
ncbi:MAG: menaquinone biosynthesis protein [Pelosinus sp.]|nr:menaquinone biosynthesis protein [Pelosinus sp.]